MNKFRETFTLTFKVSGKRYCRGGPARRELLDVYLVQAGEIRGPTTAINQTYCVLLADALLDLAQTVHGLLGTVAILVVVGHLGQLTFHRRVLNTALLLSQLKSISARNLTLNGRHLRRMLL